MNKVKQVNIVVTLLVIAMLVAACGGRKSMPSGADAEWTLVVIGDSSMWSLGEALASQIEKEMGVKLVLVDDALGALSAGEVLKALQTGKSERARLEALPAALKEAEMVVMFVNPLDSINPEHPLDANGCFMGMAPLACEEETFNQYVTDLEAIWSEVITLREGKPTILRATDIYNPLINNWKQFEIFEACNECWMNMSAANRQAAEKYGIPFFSRYDAFNGVTHDEDPTKKGYILRDGEHPSWEGALFTADLLSKMGYEPTITK